MKTWQKLVMLCTLTLMVGGFGGYIAYEANLHGIDSRHR